MTVNWSDPDVKDRILAAIVGSAGGSLNVREIARLFGPTATVSAIENFLRKPKARGRELVAAAAGGAAGSMASAARGGAGVGKRASPVKKDGVKAGRVSKKVTPKKAAMTKEEFKDEVFGEDEIFGEDDIVGEMDDEI